jgi:hypothetical protein
MVQVQGISTTLASLPTVREWLRARCGKANLSHPVTFSYYKSQTGEERHVRGSALMPRTQDRSPQSNIME